MKISKIKESISGRVILSFVVSKTGEIINIEVLKSLQTNIDTAAIKVLQK